MAFGRAGPVHAARLARELEIRRVLVPRNPGILCAMRLLLTDLRTSFAAGRMAPPAPSGLDMLAQGFAGLEAEAEAWFGAEGFAPPDRTLPASLTCATTARPHELAVPCPPDLLTAATLDVLRDRLEATHRYM